MVPKKLSLVGFVIMVLVVSLSAPALATIQDNAPGAPFFTPVMPNTITVFGFGTGRGIPDQAQISFGLMTVAALAGDAQKSHQEQVTKLILALAPVGVTPEQVSIQYFNIWPDYAYGPDGRESEIIEYRINTTITVLLKDGRLVPRAVELALAAGANRVEGIRYLSSRQGKMKQEALLAAVQNANEQARLIADALGKKVGPVVAVDQSLAPPYQLQEDQFTGSQLGTDPNSLVVTEFLRLVFSLE